MRRGLVLALVAGALSGGIASAPASADGCVSGAAAGFRHRFDAGGGSVVVRAERGLCAGQSRGFVLASYTLGANGQFVYSTDRGSITSSRREVKLTVALPGCRAAVYAVATTAVVDESTNGEPLYGDLVLGASSGDGKASVGMPALGRTGQGECTAAPGVSFVNACDNTFTAALTNPAGANAAAIFVRDGALIRVAPGGRTVVKGGATETLTFRASNFTTYVGTYRAPVGGCATAGGGGGAMASATAVPPFAGVPGTAVPVPELPFSAPAATAPAPDDSVLEPAPAPPAVGEPPAQAAGNERLSPGSLLATIFGVALVIGGIVLLVRVIRGSRRPG